MLKVTVAQSCPTLRPPFSRARILEWVASPFSRGLPNPGIKLRSPTFQADSLPTEPPGKPKKTGVGSLFLLSRSSQTRIQTGVSCFAGGFFTSWATTEALCLTKDLSVSSICRNLAFGFMGFPCSYAGLYHYIIDLCSKIYYLFWVFSAWYN